MLVVLVLVLNHQKNKNSSIISNLFKTRRGNLIRLCSCEISKADWFEQPSVKVLNSGNVVEANTTFQAHYSVFKCIASLLCYCITQNYNVPSPTKLCDSEVCCLQGKKTVKYTTYAI